MRPGRPLAASGAASHVPALFLAGLVLRLAGLFVYGMFDLDQMLLDWGAHVHRDGLAAAFGINYGVLSYAAFGMAYAAGELIPRLWWAPYKLLVLACDVAVLLVLLRLVPARHRPLVMMLFWLNPWFVLHEAYQGFWEAPVLLFALLTVWWWKAATERPRASWAIAGALLASSAMVKPQGLIYFVGPVGLMLLMVAWHTRMARPLVGFVGGLAVVVAGLSAGIWLAGGSSLAVMDNYRSAFTVMPALSNGGPGIWRFVTFVYATATHQNGPVAATRIPGPALAFLTELAGIVTVGVLVLFVARLRRVNGWADERGLITAPQLLALLCLGALTTSQFGVRAHINHTYAAMVLFIPLAAGDRALRRLWSLMAVLLGVSHVLLFGIGQAALLPAGASDGDFSAAAPLIERVMALPAYRQPDWVLNVQATVNSAVAGLPGEAVVSLLSPAVFLVACFMVVATFRTATPMVT